MDDDAYEDNRKFQNDIADEFNDDYHSDYDPWGDYDPWYVTDDDDPYLCISCDKDYYTLKRDGKCERCWRSAFTILEILSPLNIDLMNNIFSFLDIKIDHVKRVHEYKSRDKICWRFEKNGICKRGDYCRFVHVVKNPKVCIHFLKGQCHFGNICRFTHRRQKKCKWFLKGKCHFGNKCFFTHKK